MGERVRIRFFTDHGAFPLSDERGSENDPSGVEISDVLRTELESWALADSWDVWDDTWESPSPDRDDWDQYQAWKRAGEKLLERVRRELGDRFEVLSGWPEDAS